MRESFVFYRSFYEALAQAPDTVFNEVMHAICNYTLNGTETPLNQPLSPVVWTLIKPQLDANIRRYENGKKGGAPIGNKNAKKTTEKQPKTTKKQPKNNLKQPNVNVNVNDNVNVNVNVKDKPNGLFADVPPAIEREFMEWVKMRKQIKKPITTKTTVSRALGVLNGLTKNPEKQKKIINQSIDNCWQSFYELKAEEPKAPAYKEFEKQEDRREVVAMPQEIREKLNNLF